MYRNRGVPRTVKPLSGSHINTLADARRYIVENDLKHVQLSAISIT